MSLGFLTLCLGNQGAAQVAKDLVRHDGVRGLYKGFGTVIVGIIPARVVSASPVAVIGSSKGPGSPGPGTPVA